MGKDTIMPVLFELYLFKDRRDDAPFAIAGPYTSEEAAREAYYRNFQDPYTYYEILPLYE